VVHLIYIAHTTILDSLNYRAFAAPFVKLVNRHADQLLLSLLRLDDD